MLFLNNDDVKQVLTMEVTMAALDKAYHELARQEAVCRPRIDIQIPTQDPNKIYQWGTMEGGSTSGYFAIRMKSDVIYEQEYQGAITQEKYCVQPGRFCGLILLNSIQNGEPLALINDGYLQHMRSALSGIGASTSRGRCRGDGISAPAAWRDPMSSRFCKRVPNSRRFRSTARPGQSRSLRQGNQRELRFGSYSR